MRVDDVVEVRRRIEERVEPRRQMAWSIDVRQISEIPVEREG